jgi:preprotein translocase subunit SecF
MQILKTPNYDFIRWRWHAIGLSLVVVLAGVVMMVMQGLPLGIDFSGGTIVIVQTEQTVSADAIRSGVEAVSGDAVIQQYGADADRRWLIRLPELQGTVEEGANLDRASRAVVDALQKANIGPFEVVSTEVVGPVVGQELQAKGIWATLASVGGITLYIALRFRPAFAIGAIVATLHDLLIALAFLVFFKYDLSLNVVAALLTITGYSVNDTIVIFDRVREDLRTMRREPLAHVVNLAVNKTLGRTIITAGTTFLAVFSLFLFGGEVLRGFAFTMLVGIVSGTYSTVFIAAAIAILLSKQQAQARGGASTVRSVGGRKVS